MDIVSKILEAILLAFAPLVASAIATAAYGWLKRLFIGLDDHKQRIIADIVRRAVYAAEQVGATKMIEEKGAFKKAYAMQAAQKWLAERGLHIDLESLDAAIEAAVYQDLNAMRRYSDYDGAGGDIIPHSVG